MIQREALSCEDQIRKSIPQTIVITYQSQTSVKVLDINSKVLVTIESGKINEDI